MKTALQIIACLGGVFIVAILITGLFIEGGVESLKNEYSNLLIQKKFYPKMNYKDKIKLLEKITDYNKNLSGCLEDNKSVLYSIFIDDSITNCKPIKMKVIL